MRTHYPARQVVEVNVQALYKVSYTYSIDNHPAKITSANAAVVWIYNKTHCSWTKIVKQLPHPLATGSMLYLIKLHVPCRRDSVLFAKQALDGQAADCCVWSRQPSEVTKLIWYCYQQNTRNTCTSELLFWSSKLAWEITHSYWYNTRQKLWPTLGSSFLAISIDSPSMYSRQMPMSCWASVSSWRFSTTMKGTLCRTCLNLETASLNLPCVVNW